PKATALEMKARLDAFLADTEGKYEHDLPGWTRLRAVVRGEWTAFGWTFAARPRPAATKAARELFVEFLNAPGGRKLLTALDTGAGDLGPTVANLKQELYYARFPRTGGLARTPSLMEVTAVLFVDSQVNSNTGQRNTLFNNVLTLSGITQEVQKSDEKSAALRAVLVAWFDSRTEPYEMYSSMSLAASVGENGASGRLAVRLLGSAGAPVSYRGLAFTRLMQNPSKEHLPALEKLIGDNTVLSGTTRIGDLALVAAVTLTGQSLDDYHIVDRSKGVAVTSSSYTRYTIPDDKRKEAADRWKEWRAKNP
ncbi:MAG: hypothetical protein K2V38_18215, partial [Gemmataceae bacterium]|nr:hypothetical protein [Gemmataceae bacterium]